jgi:hypothetical protein
LEGRKRWRFSEEGSLERRYAYLKFLWNEEGEEIDFPEFRIQRYPINLSIRG